MNKQWSYNVSIKGLRLDTTYLCETMLNYGGTIYSSQASSNRGDWSPQIIKFNQRNVGANRYADASVSSPARR